MFNLLFKDKQEETTCTISCGVCLQKYSSDPPAVTIVDGKKCVDDDLRPAATPCGHAICMQCYSRLHIKVCPECRFQFEYEAAPHISMIKLISKRVPKTDDEIISKRVAKAIAHEKTTLSETSRKNIELERASVQRDINAKLENLRVETECVERIRKNALDQVDRAERSLISMQRELDAKKNELTSLRAGCERLRELADRKTLEHNLLRKRLADAEDRIESIINNGTLEISADEIMDYVDAQIADKTMCAPDIDAGVLHIRDRLHLIECSMYLQLANERAAKKCVYSSDDASTQDRLGKLEIHRIPFEFDANLARLLTWTVDADKYGWNLKLYMFLNDKIQHGARHTAFFATIHEILSSLRVKLKKYRHSLDEAIKLGFRELIGEEPDYVYIADQSLSDFMQGEITDPLWFSTHGRGDDRRVKNMYSCSKGRVFGLYEIMFVVARCLTGEKSIKSRSTKRHNSDKQAIYPACADVHNSNTRDKNTRVSDTTGEFDPCVYTDQVLITPPGEYERKLREYNMCARPNLPSMYDPLY